MAAAGADRPRQRPDRRRPDRRRPDRQALLQVLVVVAVVAAAVAAYSSARGPDVQAAPEGASAACTELLRQLPAALDGRAREEVAVPGVTVWEGDGTTVLRCGVPPPGPTTARCIPVSGPGGEHAVDWLLDAESERAVRFVSFGRTPAVEVTVHATGAAATATLVDLGPAVSALPVTRRCS